MAGDLTTTIQELRKQYYDDHLQDDVPKEASRMAEVFLTKSRKFKLGGLGLNAKMSLRNATGVGFGTLSEGAAYPAAGFQSAVTPVVSCAHFAATVRWTGHVVAMGSSKEMSFQTRTVVKQNLEDLEQQNKSYIKRMLMWDGTSILGTTAAASGTTGGYITLATGSAPIHFFEAGQILTLRSASTAGSERLTNAATGAGRILQIRFDTSPPQIVLTDATGATAGGGDYVAWANVYDTTVISGLRAWVNNTGTFMGLDRATGANAAMRSLLVNAGGASLGPTDADVIRDKVQDVQAQRGEYKSMWVGSRRTRRSLIATTVGQVRFTGLKKQEVGSPDIAINDRDGEKMFEADENCLDTELFVIDATKVCYGSPEGMEGVRMVESNGSAIHQGRSSDLPADFFTSHTTWRGNFGMDDCRAAGKLYNYTPAT